MGKLQKKRNRKARQSQESTGTIRTSKKSETTEKLTQSRVTDVLSPELKPSEYCTDTGNELLIVPDKTGTGGSGMKGDKLKSPQTQQKLSKKQRKVLEKVVEKKKKKAQRAELLDALSKVQVASDELSLYKSTSLIGQIHRKRKCDSPGMLDEDTKIVSSLRGKKKGKRERLMKKLMQKHENHAETFSSESSESLSDSDDSANEHSVDNVVIETVEIDKVSDKVITSEKTAPCVCEEVQEVQNMQDTNTAIPKPKVEMHTEQPVKVQKAAIHVALERKPELQQARLLLPILAEEQVIMETIQENEVTLLCGETGSGKTTQVPQFLYEAGFSSSSTHKGIIGVTEPRRVAAISMSKRVAEEMNLNTRVVSYQIRYEGNVTEETKVKFMTDGVLLKEIESDFLLSKYSIVIIDEAHERSVFTDILIGLLSRIVPLRNKQNKPLKLIIMSATLRVEDFTENKRLFKNLPPVIKVDSRQYPVTIHFNKRTSSDYITDAFKKACKIHRTLKQGGILIFVTGQNEVHVLCKKLRRAFPYRTSGETDLKDKRESETPATMPSKQREAVNSLSNTLPDVNLDRYSSCPALDPYSESEDDEDGDEDIYLSNEEDQNITDGPAYTANEDAPMHVLPLYSLLSSSRQAKVFSPPPSGTRLCVVATNVAETSLTIPGITYVIDTGRVKRKLYDKLTGVSAFRVTWTSKASANQRAGRAGRVEPGHCYRLYSSAVFQNEFEEFSEPEIQRRPVDDLLLQMKSMGIDKIVNFPFPTPPDAEAIKVSERLLLDLGALEKRKNRMGNLTAVVSDLGRTIAKIPVSPRYAKMITLSHTEDCMQYVISVVAALTVKEIFTDDISSLNELPDVNKEDAKKKRIIITQARRKWAGEGTCALLGDLMVILRAIGACEYCGCSETFCRDNGLRYKAMIEIRKLRAQLTNAVNAVLPEVRAFVDAKMKPPSPDQANIIRQVVLAGLGDHVARKMPSSETTDVKLKNAYQSCSLDDPVFIHPSSSLFTKLPEFVVYQEIQETSKLYMKGITAIDPTWLPLYVRHKCKFSKPLETPAPNFDDESGNVICHMTYTFGPHMWPLPAQELEFPNGLDRFRWFGRFLLEGKVMKKLAEFTPLLLTPPSVMVKSWSKLQPRTDAVLNELVRADVCNRTSLLNVWKTDPTFLLAAFKGWVPESKHTTLTMMWPPTE